MILSLIVAMDAERGIGKDGKLPWRLRADLKNFKQVTMGHHLILGRKTYESIGGALPGRKLIVITHQTDFRAPDSIIVHNFESALTRVRDSKDPEVFIIGGGEVYAQSIRQADRLYLTQVHAILNCDTFFPEIQWYQWAEVERREHPRDEHNEYPFTYRVLMRKRAF